MQDALVASMPRSDAAYLPEASPSLAEFDLLGELGEGTTGKVLRAQHRSTGHVVALKLYDKLYWHERLMWNEAEKLQLLDHSNLPRLVSCWEEENAVCLVTVLVAGPDLWREVAPESIQSLPLTEVLDCAIQMSDALVYLHTLPMPIIHGDVKPRNMVRDASGRVVLVDFEGSRFVGEAGYAQMGSWGYCAPELEQGRPAPRSDVYALGLSLWQLLSGRLPEPQQGIFPPLPAECPLTLGAFLQRMVAPQETQRPTSQECLAYFQTLVAMGSAPTRHHERYGNRLLPLLFHKSGKIQTWLRWRAAGRRVSERLTLRLAGWKPIPKLRDYAALHKRPPKMRQGSPFLPDEMGEPL